MLQGAVPTPVPNPTQSYWLKALPAAARPPCLRTTSSGANGTPRPRLPEAADVAIIGGGIAGVSAAYHLRKARPELQVVLLEARQLSHGATGRNGGLLWPALNAPWLKTAARYGPTEAARMMAFELACLRDLTAFITATPGLAEEVRYAPFADGAFHVYESEAEMEVELAELAAMQQAGIHTDMQPLSRAQTASLLGTRAYAGAVRQPGVARVWAARLVTALARMAAEAGPPQGLTVAEQTRVVAVQPVDGEAGREANGGGALPPGLQLQSGQGGAQWLGGATGAGAGAGSAAGAAAGAVPREAVNNIVPLMRTSALGAPLTELLDPSAAPLLRVVTEAGDCLLARRVLHCTNAYGSALLPELRGALVPVRNHVAATRQPRADGGSSPNGNGNGNGRPAGRFPLDAAFYARGGYVYWSVREDGRVVLGGFRDVVPGLEWGVYDDASLDEVVRQHLRDYLPRHFPDAFGQPGALQLEAEWSGILGFTQDRFPFVGPVPGRRGQFLAAGFSGHGMTRTFTCGRVLADMLVGAPLDPAFPPTWMPAPGRFGPATPVVPGPGAAAGAVYR